MNGRMTVPKSSRNTRARRGQALIEFTFVGIPMIFLLVSIFEISRGMWIYHTLAYSVKVGVRYASVHGFNCSPNSGLPTLNTCQVNMGPASGNPADCNYSVSPPATPLTIATVIWCAAVGADPNATTLTFTDLSGTSAACSLMTCPGTTWPTTKGYQVGSPISIQIITPFKSMIAMFWPGASPVSFSAANLPASSWDTVKF